MYLFSYLMKGRAAIHHYKEMMSGFDIRKLLIFFGYLKEGRKGSLTRHLTVASYPLKIWEYGNPENELIYLIVTI